MAWPLTVNTTYANGTVVAATYLNNIETGIVNLYTGTSSLKALQIDGTGGAVVAPAAGSLVVSGAMSGASLALTGAITTATTATVTSTANGTSAPTPTISKGVLYGDLLPIAWGVFNSGGTLVRGVNIAACAKTGTGAYQVTLTTAGADSSMAIIVTPLVVAARMITVGLSSSTVFTVQTYNSSAAATDTQSSFVVFSA